VSEICKNWSTWLKKTRFSYMDEIQVQQTFNWLFSVRDEVLRLADIKEGERVVDFGCGSGLIGFGVLEKFEDKVELIFSDKFADCIDECKKILETMNTKSNVKFLQSDIADIKMKNDYIDKAMTRSVLVHVKDKQPVFNELYRVLKPNGFYCAFEPIISQNTRYYELLLPNQISDYFEFKKAEKEFMENPDDPLVNFTGETLENNLKTAGFSDVNVDIKITRSEYIAKKEAIKSWMITPPAPNQKTMKERFLKYFDEKKVDNFIDELILALSDKMVKIQAKTAFIKAVK